MRSYPDVIGIITIICCAFMLQGCATTDCQKECSPENLAGACLDKDKYVATVDECLRITKVAE